MEKHTKAYDWLSMNDVRMVVCVCVDAHEVHSALEV